MENTQIITLDLSGSSGVPLVEAKQGDSGTRYITAELTNNGIAYTPPDGATAKVRYLRRDGKDCTGEAAINADGTISAEIPAPAISQCGQVRADVCLFGADGEVLSSAGFLILVHPSPIGNGTVYSGEFSVTASGDAIIITTSLPVSTDGDAIVIGGT